MPAPAVSSTGGRGAFWLRPLSALASHTYDAFLDLRPERRALFTSPAGEAAFTPATSVSWKIFSNPVALFCGGASAVLLELAEPRVRDGVWQHTDFKTDPKGRLQRTGFAAMVSVYAAQSVATSMIEGINRRHEAIRGRTDEGQPYAASDPDLLKWVHTTASYGFARAYAAFVTPLTDEEKDAAVAEAAPIGKAYGVLDPPTDWAAMERYLTSNQELLRPSPILTQFLEILAAAPILPIWARAFQRPLVRSATALLPPGMAQHIDLAPAWQATSTDMLIAKRLAQTVAAIPVDHHPAIWAAERVEASG